VQKAIVVIIGGPGTGKTTIINALIEKGFCCFPEISREITLQAQKEGIDHFFLEKPLLFSQMLLDGRENQYKEALKNEHDLIFLDRGTPDVLAYMSFIGDDYPESFDEICKNCVYSKIFILPPWKEIYTSDEERYENFEQAQQIYHHLQQTYHKYYNETILVPLGTIEERVDFILKNS
jgi:predicted ATPase